MGETLCPLDGTNLENAYLQGFFSSFMKDNVYHKKNVIGNARYHLVKGLFLSNEARYN